jgi:hypothetical protein
VDRDSDRVSDAAHDPRAPLSVATDLTLTIDGTDARVTSTGERVFVEFASVADAVRAFRASGASEARTNRLATLLRTTDLTVEVRVHGRTVAVVGTDARPGVVSQRLGVAPAEVRLGGGLGAVGRELADGVATLRRALR